MDDIKSCPQCGFKCALYQLNKTSGQCPRCYPEAAQAYVANIKQRRGM